jgi:hypothetical protein
MKMKLKMTSRLRTAAALPALLVGLWTAPSPASADLYVLESTVPAIKSGVRLGDGETVSIPGGAHIRAMLPSGKTQTIRGPYSGSVGDLAKGQVPNEGVLGWVRNILQTGGATEATPGAVRSIGRAPPKPRGGFSWSAIPATMDATVCVVKGASLELVRAPSARSERVAVIDAARGERGEANWSENSEPANLPPRADAVYDLIVQGRPRKQLTLRMLDALPADADVLTELHRLGCKHQFEAWVRERLAAK